MQIEHFQKELDELKTRCRNSDFVVGSKDEMRDLRKESENLHTFAVEIKDTTEVHFTHITNNITQCVSWYYLVFADYTTVYLGMLLEMSLIVISASFNKRVCECAVCAW